MEKTVVDESFDKMFRAEFEATVRIVTRLVFFRTVAEDICAEAFARAVRDWNKVRKHEAPEKWVCRVAINLALDQIRKEAKNNKYIYAQQESSQAKARDFESEQELHLALSRLSKQQNKILTLRYFLDYSEQEISDTLKLHIGTVKTHLKRALDNLKSDENLTNYFASDASKA